MVAERFQIAQSLRVRAGGALERAAGPLVQLGPAGQQEILVDHLVHERVREPVAAALAAAPDLLDQIGLDEAVERGLGGPSYRSQRQAAAPRRTPSPARPPPGAGAGRRPGAGRRGRAAARAAWAERSPPRRPPCTPSDRPGERARPCSPGCGRSPRRTADCPRPASRRNPGPGRRRPRPPGRTDRPQAPASRQERAGRAG